MLKQVSIFIIASIMFFEGLLPKGIGFSQASKIGDLYSHFITHRNEGISFEEFLWMHYSSESKHKANNDDHKKLPSLESQFTFIAFVSNCAISTDCYSKTFEISDRLVLNKTDNLYQFQYLRFLLNPPQFS